MDIVMIGISVENADLALLGSVSFTDTAKLEMLNLLGGLDIAAGVILSTCNRSEMYLSCDAHRAKEAADLYRSFFHLGQEEKIRVLSGKAACRWLFEGGAGLRSLGPGCYQNEGGGLLLPRRASPRLGGLPTGRLSDRSGGR